MSDTTTEDINQVNNNKEQRRKRIKRIKTTIIAFALVLLILPSVSCVFLSIKLVELQEQVNRLAILYNHEDVLNKKNTFDNIAYAAEKASDEADTDTDITTDNKAEIDDINSDATSADRDLANSDDITDNLPEKPGTYDDTPDSTIFPDPNTIQNSDSNDADLPASEASAGGIEEGTADTHTIDGTNYEVNDARIIDDLLNGNSGDNTNGRFQGKKVYLTFDDGPSIYTDDILDILNEYGVKATFFVIGKTDSFSKKMYKRIVDEGHTLGMHSYSHKYDVIYNSVEDFDKDFTKQWNLLYDTTGSEPKIYRFPGGSDNGVNKKGMNDFIKYLNEKDIVYFDWNVLNGDATKIKYTEEQLIANVLNGVTTKKTSIVLMHDAASKEATVKTLPELLKQLISGGAELYPLDASVTPIQMIKADSVN